MQEKMGFWPNRGHMVVAHFSSCFRWAAPSASYEVRSTMPWATDHWPRPATKRPWNLMCTASKPLTFWRPTTCWQHKKVKWLRPQLLVNMLILIYCPCTNPWYTKHVFFIEKEFLDSLPLSQQCTEEEEELLHFLFENKLKKVGEA